MKILTMYQTNQDGGLFKRLLYLIEGMLEEGWEVHYISTGEFPIRHENLHFHKVNGFEYLKIPLFFKFLPQAMAASFFLARKEKFNKLIVFGSAYGLIGWFLKLFYKLPLFTFVRADLLENLRIQGRTKYVRLVSFWEKKALEASDKIIVNATSLKKKIAANYKIPKNKIYLLHNNILPQFRRRKQKILEGEYIGFVGILEKRKGVDYLLKAYANVHKEIDKKLIIVGRGPLEEELRKIVKKYDLKDKVEFYGWRSDIADIMSSIDLLIVPSLSEGSPNVVLEALGCETLCIGSNVDGIAEVLKYKELLFEPANQEAIAEKLRWVFKNYAKAKELCMERRKEFTFDWRKECVEMIRGQEN